MKYKYIFFDFDGTLINTFDGVVKIFDMTFAKYGKVIKRSDYTKYIGPPLSDTFRDLLGESNEADAVEYFRYQYKINDAGKLTKPYEGIAQCLKRLKELGYVVGVATCKIQEEAENLLDYFDFKKYIDIVSGLWYNIREQKSEILQYAIDQLGADKNECLMIGDTKFDVEGAELVGVNCILCLWGFGDCDSIKNSNVVARVEKPSQIIDFLEK